MRGTDAPGLAPVSHAGVWVELRGASTELKPPKTFPAVPSLQTRACFRVRARPPRSRRAPAGDGITRNSPSCTTPS